MEGTFEIHPRVAVILMAVLYFRFGLTKLGQVQLLAENSSNSTWQEMKRDRNDQKMPMKGGSKQQGSVEKMLQHVIILLLGGKDDSDSYLRKIQQLSQKKT